MKLLQKLKRRSVSIETETGSRSPKEGISKHTLFFIPLLWSLFQLWYASPLPFYFNFFVINDTEARAIHLMFAVFLAFTAFPTLKSSPRDRIPLQDWILGFIAAACAVYLFAFYNELAERPGRPTTADIVVTIAGMSLLLEATRRALGPPLMIVAAIFLTYAFGGAYMPEVIEHSGVGLSKAASHYWLSTEGVFGVPLGVSTSMVFMFVLFGSLLETAGAGNYFIRTAFAALGHMKGGPAKAAVVASGLTGLVSGSSIANVVTTGTFTIPLMKKVGFPAEKAGAVEVASSTNGQLTPPVMGAAAFLIVEYVGISYIDVIKHAFLPAVISYIALVYIVHLEACKLDLKGLPKRKTSIEQKRKSRKTLALGILEFVIVVTGSYFLLQGMKNYAGDCAVWFAIPAILFSYIVLLYKACQVPELETSTDVTEIPEFTQTAQAGLHFLLPISVLMWCLIIERFSPALSAFYATILMMIVVVTQRPLQGIIRKKSGYDYTVKRGFDDLIKGMVNGAKNMVAIGVATAAAGIVVGTVTITGLGLVMTEFVELISGGNLVLILVFTAIISLILGVGLPTTANYIVVSSLMAPVIVELGAQNGLIVPLIAVHLFVFYFGILADDTPPVGLAAFAAAGISGGDPIKTGLQGFGYDIRTAILPFIFIFNTELLMIGVESLFHASVVVVAAVIAMLAFAAATQRYFLTHNRLWETLALLLVAFTLFRPGFFWDQVFPEYDSRPASQLERILEQTQDGAQLIMRIAGESMSGDEFKSTISLRVEDDESGLAKLEALGLETRIEKDRVLIEDVAFMSAAKKAGLEYDQEILSVEVKNDRLPKQLMFIPALVLLGIVALCQKKRRASLYQ